MRRDMVAPSSSPMLIMASPSTAGPWCAACAMRDRNELWILLLLSDSIMINRQSWHQHTLMSQAQLLLPRNPSPSLSHAAFPQWHNVHLPLLHNAAWDRMSLGCEGALPET